MRHDALMTIEEGGSALEERAIDERTQARIQEALSASWSDSTRRNYRAQWEAFHEWADAAGRSSMPASADTICAFVTERAESGYRPASIRVALAAIGFAHRTAELANPCETEQVRRVVSGVTRKLGAHQRQARPIDRAAYSAIVATARLPRRGRGGKLETVETATARGNIDIALVAVMRDAMLRVSEAAAITWGDVRPSGDGTGTVHIVRSKSDQEGEGADLYLSEPTMKALEAARRDDADDSDPVFGLSSRQIVRRLKSAAKAAGLGEGFSGHSPRVGVAQDLAKAGGSLVELQEAGRWSSPSMPARYSRRVRAGSGAVARLLYGEA